MASFLYIGISALCLATTVMKAAVCVSTGSGTWTDTATWSCGHIPTCGDSVVIQATHTVQITAHDLTGCATKVIVSIKGDLEFVSIGKLELSCLGRVYVYSGGRVVPKSGNTGNQNAIMTCNSTWWNAGAGIYTGPGCMPPTVPGCAAALPVELIYFKGDVCERGSVCLEWKTAVEKDHLFFSVARSSDGVNFAEAIPVSIGVNPRGALYKWVDHTPVTGTNYYRLTQKDAGGTETTFPTIAVMQNLSSATSSRLYPNPNDGTFVLEAEGLQHAAYVQVIVYNMLGRKVASFEVANQHLRDSLKISLPEGLPAGMYLATFSSGSLQVRENLVLQ